MTPEGHNDLYPLLERILRSSDKPLNCHELYDMEEVRNVAPSVNRVSDYLGVMFRKGQVSRVPADAASTMPTRARWSYVWREKVTPEWKQTTQVKADPVTYRPKPILDRPNVYITEDGGHITLDMPEITIQIQLKKPQRQKD